MQLTRIGPAGSFPVRRLEHGVGHALPDGGLVQKNEKIEARPVVAQALDQRIHCGGRLLQMFRTPDRQIEIGVLAAHEKADLKGANFFADQRQQKNGLALIVAQHRDMGRILGHASDVIPPARHPGMMLVAAAEGSLLYHFAPQELDLPELGQDFDRAPHRRVNR